MIAETVWFDSGLLESKFWRGVNFLPDGTELYQESGVVPSGKTWKTNHAESTWSSQPIYCSPPFTPARMPVAHAPLFQQEMEHLWFFFLKIIFFFLLQMIRRGNLAFLNPLHKACIFQPVGGFESRIFEIFFPNDCLKDWSGSHHRAYTFLNLDISCKWSMMAS